MKTIINQYIEDRVKREKFYSDLAIVKSIDETSRKATVEIVNSDLEITARAQATINITGGLFIKPTIDSYVVVNWINGKSCYIALYSDVDEMVFQNGDNLGVPITPDVVSRLNIIEQDLNDIKQVFSTWTPVATDGGAALKAAAATWYGSTLTQTTNDDIQNENFKQ